MQMIKAARRYESPTTACTRTGVPPAGDAHVGTAGESSWFSLSGVASRVAVNEAISDVWSVVRTHQMAELCKTTGQPLPTCRCSGPATTSSAYISGVVRWSAALRAGR